MVSKTEFCKIDRYIFGNSSLHCEFVTRWSDLTALQQFVAVLYKKFQRRNDAMNKQVAATAKTAAQ